MNAARFPRLPAALTEAELPEAYRQILAMLRDGKTIGEIAEALRVWPAAVAYRLYLLRERLPAGSVPAAVRRLPMPRSPETLFDVDRTILALLGKGMTPAEIAPRTGFSCGRGVQSRINRMKKMVAAGAEINIPPAAKARFEASASNPFAKRIKCLRCRKEFNSPDRRTHRFCARCKSSLNRLEAAGGMDEHSILF